MDGAELIKQINDLRRRIADLERLENTMARSYGYFGGAWVKNPLQMGYLGPVNLITNNTSLAAGANNLDLTTVPANRVYVITNITVMYTGTVSGVRLLVNKVDAGAVQYALFDVQSITSQLYYDRQGMWVLNAGEFLRLAITGATLNDDAYIRGNGWYFDTNL